MESAGAVGLGVIAPFGLARRVLAADEVVDADNFDLSGVTLPRAGAAVLAETCPLEAAIHEILLPLELLLQRAEFFLLLLHQFLEPGLELLLLGSLLLR